MKKRTSVLAALATAGIMAAGSVQADIWCNGGTVMTVADVEWDYADLLNYTQNIVAPPNAYNPDMYVASEAAQNYCGTYAGGGGPHWSLVPGSGSVSHEIYAPDPYSPDYYQLQEGLAFECNKCYTYAPVRRRFRLD